MNREQKIQLLQDIKTGKKTIHDIPGPEQDFSKLTSFELFLFLDIMKKYSWDNPDGRPNCNLQSWTLAEQKFYHTMNRLLEERPTGYGDNKDSNDWISGKKMDNWERDNELRAM